MTVFITLNQIRANSPCEDGWQKLLNHLGKTKADDEPLKFSTILESNGVSDAFWCVDALPKEFLKERLLLLADVAERVLFIYEKEFPDCDKPRKAVEATRGFANGDMTDEELTAAMDAAWAAASEAASEAASDAARAAAWAAARAEVDAAWAVRAVADAAWAARAAAWDAASEAAMDAARAAASDASDDAWAAAEDAERKAQGELLIKHLG